MIKAIFFALVAAIIGLAVFSTVAFFIKPIVFVTIFYCTYKVVKGDWQVG